MFSKFFAFLFIASLALFLFFWLNTADVNTQSTVKHAPYSQSYQKPMPSVTVEPDLFTNIFNDSQFLMIASLITSVFSFLGFLISLKSSYKENQLIDLQKEREGLEMEKLKAEIDLLKNRKI
ncbi:hypothetical protein KKC13_04735 [bacterium]|nr:hypothetical protein [bacterium]MBU1958533.1 hypothetical protein [bacterium]